VCVAGRSASRGANGLPFLPSGSAAAAAAVSNVGVGSKSADDDDVRTVFAINFRLLQ